MLTTDEISSLDFTGDVHLVYEIETNDDYLCASGFGLESYDNMTSSSPLIYLLRSIDISGSALKGCIVAFGDFNSLRRFFVASLLMLGKIEH